MVEINTNLAVTRENARRLRFEPVGLNTATNVQKAIEQIETALTLTNHAVLVGSGTSAINSIAVPANGTLFQGRAAADPLWTATPTLGIAGTTQGTLALTGNTSGTITITPQAAAGTATLTLPNASGTFAVSVTAPLALSATTGNLTIPGTVGQVLAGATPAFTATPVLGVNASTAGTLGLANGGGSGATVTLQNTSATSAYNFNFPITAGSSGQMLQSGGGAATANAWSTATFPGTASNVGTILRADGTNWVATTATYPATSTINQILYSSSTNTIAGLATANGSILNTNSTGVPALTPTPVLGVAGATVGSIGFQNASSGTITLSPVAGALGSVTLTLPAATDTVAVLAASQAFTNKTYNGNTWTAGTGTLTIAASKTLTANNNLTLAGTDGKTLTLTNGLTVTTNDGTLAFGAASKTLTVNNSLTLAGTDATTMTFPGASDTVGGLGTAQTWTKQNIHTVATTVASATAAVLDDVKVAAATTTITGNTGSPITKLAKVGLYQPTLTDASAVTVTDAATLYVDNAPTASGSVTITNAWALLVGTGATKLQATTINAALTYGGVALSNAVTGTGNMMLSASPTTTGMLTGAAANFSGTITFGTGTITALTNKATPDSANDYIIIYDNAGTAVKKATVGAVGSVGAVSSLNGQTGALALIVFPQGRVTLTSATPVLTATVTGATTVYYTPYTGNVVPIYDGTNFVPTAFAEVSQATTDNTKSPAAVAASSVYDLFCWTDSGTNRCTRGPVWTNATTRSAGTALVRVNGIYLNNASITNGPAASRGTYVGTIASNGSSTIDYILGASASGGTAAVLNVDNMYNRVLIQTSVTDSGAGYAYPSITVRQARASAGNQASFVIGQPESSVAFSHSQRVDTIAAASAIGSWGVGLDSTTAYVQAKNIITSVAAVSYIGGGTNAGFTTPGIGSHYLAALENSDGTNANVFNNGTNATLSISLMR